MTRLALCLLLLATGASADPRETRPMPYGAKVYHDDERSVTCWQMSSGLSCIPDSQLQASTDAVIPASPHEQQPEPTPALAPGRWIDERYEL